MYKPNIYLHHIRAVYCEENTIELPGFRHMLNEIDSNYVPVGRNYQNISILCTMKMLVK